MRREPSVRGQVGLGLALVAIAAKGMAIDLEPLWDFSNPAESERRIQAALQGAAGDDALILQTQIARSHGLRKDFDRARELLESIRPRIASAGPEARARHALELGRAYASATHPPPLLTEQAKALARESFQSAVDIARSAQLDGLAIDAIHMLAFVDTSPERQLHWGREALGVVEASAQPAAKRWEASIRNNIGFALHQLGRFDEALVEFKRAVVLRELRGDAGAVRVAHWMVAWTLRALGRLDEALSIQLRLERECEAANSPDRYVFEELEVLYRERGDPGRAEHYAALKAAASK